MRAKWGRVALAASAAGFLVDTAWAVSTFAVARPFLPQWPLFVLFLGIFPIHFRTVIGLRRRVGSSRRFREWVRTQIPRRWQLAGGFAFVALWVVGATALWGLRHGGPHAAQGRYFADNHGALTPISKAAFYHLQLCEQRLFSAVPAAFYLVGALYNAAVGAR